MHATRGGNNDFPWAQLESIRMTPEERHLAMITYTQASRIVDMVIDVARAIRRAGDGVQRAVRQLYGAPGQ